MIINLKDRYDIDYKRIGGKAKSLSKLVSQGFRIPMGFVITADMQKSFFERNSINKIIKKEKNNLVSKDFGILTSSAKLIRDTIVNASFSDDEKKQITNALDELVNATDINMKFAVRSSAGVEDGMTDSWAGQFDSYLDIEKDDIPSYIKRCWASMFSVRAIQYNADLLFGNNIAPFSVIVQHMIHGECSGIAFSVDPYDFDEGHIRVEAVYGTGESVVGGQEIPYGVVLDKQDGLIIHRSFGGMGRIELLKPSILKALTEEVIKIESLYGFPVDVEWTVKDSQIYILQARPITTVNVKQENTIQDMPDILDYELTFKVSGLGFMFADLLCRGFGYLHPLFICNDGDFLQYFTKERMEYAARYGHRWLSTEGGFAKYKDDFFKFHQKAFPILNKIVQEELSAEYLKEFFEIIYEYFEYYSKMDFQFTNLTYLYAEENPTIANSLQQLAAFKDIARVWINSVSIDDDSLLNKLIVKIVDKYNIDMNEIANYKVSEIIDLYEKKYIAKSEIEERSNSAETPCWS